MKRNARFLTIFTALVMTLMTTFTVYADTRYSEREIREIARRNGYDHGFREGREDRRDRRSFDFRRNRVYRDGTLGCRGAYDCDDEYRDAFRRAFENGYREAYYRGGGGWGWNDPWWRRDRYDRDDCDVFGRPRRRF